MRKLAPGQPVYFVTLVGVVFAAAWAGALIVRVRLGPSSIAGWRESIGVPLALYIALVIVQAVHATIRFDSLIVAGLGCCLTWRRFRPSCSPISGRCGAA